jgi:hypothetical protein
MGRAAVIDNLPPNEKWEGDEDLVRLLRAANRSVGGESAVPDELLAAYVQGAADERQIEIVKSALARDPALRRSVLKLMQDAERPSTESERAAFDEATPPPIAFNKELGPLMRTLRQSQPVPGGRRWREWLFGGWAVATTAGLIVTQLSRQAPRYVEGPPQGEPDTRPSPTQPAPPATVPEPEYLVAMLDPVTLRGATRSGMEEQRITIKSSERIILLKAEPPLGLADEVPIQLTIVGPQNTVLKSETHTAGELASSTRTIVLQSPRGFTAGAYNVRMTVPSDTTQSIVYPFTLRIE